MSMHKTCRLCASATEHSKFKKIFGLPSKHISDIVTKIYECTSIKVLDTEKPTPVICRKCSVRLNKFHIFKMQCIKVNNRLQKDILKKQKHDDPGTKMDEPALSYQDDVLDVARPSPTKSTKITESQRASSSTLPESSMVTRQLKGLFPAQLTNSFCNKNVKVEADDMEMFQQNPSELVSCVLNYANDLEVLKSELPSVFYGESTSKCQENNNETHGVDIGQGISIKYEPLSLDCVDSTEKLCNNCGPVLAFADQSCCPICNIVFPEERKQTKKDNSAVSFKCNICSEEFNSKPTLLAHLRYHARMNKFVCGVCRSKFTSGNNLLKHYKVKHKNCSNLSCSFCKLSNKRHKSLTALLSHMYKKHDVDASIDSSSDEDYGVNIPHLPNQDEYYDKELSGACLRKRGRPPKNVKPIKDMDPSVDSSSKEDNNQIESHKELPVNSLKNCGRPPGKKRGRPPKYVKPTIDRDANAESSSDRNNKQVECYKELPVNRLKKHGQPPGKKRGRPPKNVKPTKDMDTSSDEDYDPGVPHSMNQDENYDEELTFNILKNCSGPTKRVKPIKLKEASLCSYCGKTFSKFHYLKAHIHLIHLNIKNYQCALCEKRYSALTRLRDHISSVHEQRKFQCSLCGSLLSSLSGLSGHMRKHKNRNKEPTLKCPLCPKLFKKKENVDRHMRSHTGETPYKCSHCPREFTVSWNLKQHERLHRGEKPYKCNMCDKAFTYNCSLKNHMKYHKDEAEVATMEEPCV